MPIPSKDIVQSTLKPFHDEIVEIIIGGWSDWKESGRNGIWRCKRSRASFVWEQIIDRAHRIFATNTNIRVLDGTETYKFLVSDVVLFRFKKADERGISSNIGTQLALAFHDHEQDLFGLPTVHRVDVVYKLNALETEVRDICVVAREGNQVIWEYSMLDTVEGVIPLPIPQPEEPVRKPLVRLVKSETNQAKRKKQD
jgi:hypothetical protein